MIEETEDVDTGGNDLDGIINDIEEPKNKVNPFDQSNILSKFFSIWILPFLWTGFRKTLKEEDIPVVPKIYESKKVFTKYESKYRRVRNTKYPLFFSLVLFIWKEMVILEVVDVLTIALSLTSPFLQRIILENMFPKDDTATWILKTFLKKISGGLNNHVRIQGMNGLFGKVYHKLLHFSPKSISEHGSQSFMTYMNVEIGFIIMLPPALMGIYKQPLLLIASVVLLFVNLSWPAFFIVLVVVVLIPIYFILSVVMLAIFLPLLKLFSENTKFISGVLKGIRVVKTNAWENVFLERIMERRKKFVRYIVFYFILIILFAVTYLLSPIIMQLVLFTVTFTMKKENFTISKIFPSLTYIWLFSAAITALPALIMASGKGILSLHRMEKLLKNDEYDRRVFYSDSDEDDEDEDEDRKKYSIVMKNCSFKWYKKPEKKKGRMGKVGEKIIGKFSSCLGSDRMKRMREARNKRKNRSSSNSNQTVGMGLLGNEDIELKEIDEDEEENENENDLENDKKKKIGSLDNISLKIEKGSVVYIIGEVGSGKSMLLASLIAELEKTNVEGKIYLHEDKVSFCGQESWIINATVEDNITFGNPPNEQLFQKVLEACALEKDVALFPNGIHTEVGERGITLSGGQKQRISLARGFFNSADLYLLDDISSSVDPDVCQIIFNKGIYGLVKDKTRVIVTNELSWLSKSDYIIALEDGKIKEEGRYDELVIKEDGFVKYLLEKFTIAKKSIVGSSSQNIKKKEEEKKENEDEEIIIEIKGSEDEKTDEEEESKEPNNEIIFSEVDLSKKPKLEEEEEELDGLEEDIEEYLKPNKNKSNKKSQEYKSLMMKEEIAEGSVGFKTIWFYFQSFGCYNATWSAILTLSLLIIFTIFAFLYGQLLPIWLSFWTTDYLGMEDETYLFVYGFFGITQPIIAIFRYFLIILFSLVSGVRITRKVFKRLFKTPLSYWERTPLGRVMNRLSGDQFKCDFVIVPLDFFITSVLDLIFSLVTIGLTNWISIIIFIPIIPIYILVQEFYRRSSRQVRRIRAVSRSPMMALLQETVDGVHIIRSYNAESHFFDRFCERIDKTIKIDFMGFQINIWLQFVLGIISSVVVISSGILMISFRDVNAFGAGIVVLSGLSFSNLLQLSEKLSIIVRNVVLIEQTFNSVERLSYYAKDLEIEKIGRSSDDIIFKKDWAKSNNFKIQFNDISMRYREELPLILEDISFEIQPREKIGIIGRTGAGKTSLFNVLFRLVEPSSGSIVIDGLNVTGEKFGLTDLRDVMSMIPQDPFLFKGSIRFNIDPLGIIKDERLLWDVLDKCRLRKTVEAYQKKLNHDLDGNNLSSGEKQLICLARSMIRKTKILCLDEPTSNIDMESESFVRETIEREFKDCIVLTIAHRIHTIANSDRLLVLGNEGKIEELDTPYTLARDENSLFFKTLSNLEEENRNKLMDIMELKYIQKMNESQSSDVVGDDVVNDDEI